MHAAAHQHETAQAVGYKRRSPEKGVVYRVLQAHWANFAEQASRTHGRIPKFVQAEVDAFLECGVLACGFVIAKCESCEREELVPFSCKRRGFCGSCIGRRMNETAAHLVESVLPEVPIRQWVASYSWRLRYLMGYDRHLASEVQGAFVQTVGERIAWLVKRKLRLESVRQVKTGSVLFTQRFDSLRSSAKPEIDQLHGLTSVPLWSISHVVDSGLRLNVHGHLQALDGGYVQSEDGLVFHELDPITEEDVRWVAERSWKRTEAILRKHGRSLDEDTGLQGPVADEQPFLAECYTQAIAGKGTVRLGDDESDPGSSSPRLVAQVGGINVHAERVVDGRDRPQLERLCRYMLRPPLAQNRLSLLSDGRVRYEMKRAWSDGTRSLVLDSGGDGCALASAQHRGVVYGGAIGVGAGAMIPAGVEVFVGLEPIDLRWGFDRLCDAVREHIGRDARGGALFRVLRSPTRSAQGSVRGPDRNVRVLQAPRPRPIRPARRAAGQRTGSH